MSQENFFDKFLTQKPKNYISVQIYCFIPPKYPVLTTYHSLLNT